MLVDGVPIDSDLARNPIRSCKSRGSRTRETIRAHTREALEGRKPDAENNKRAPRRAPVKVWRRSPDSNRGSGLCRPVPYHLATSPYEKGRTYPAGNAWSGLRGSNPRPQPWQGCALPTALSPQKQGILYGAKPIGASPFSKSDGETVKHRRRERSLRQRPPSRRRARRRARPGASPDEPPSPLPSACA